MSMIPHRIVEQLSHGPASAAELVLRLAVSQPSLSRAIRRLERDGQVIRLLGSTRGARYGLRRRVGDAGSSWPLYRVDPWGSARQIATLHAIERDQYHGAEGPGRIRGLFESLPYYLQDLRPGGFLGRAIPAAHPELALPMRVNDWTDTHALTYLARRGSQSTGDLILGTESLDDYLTDTHGPRSIALAERTRAYPAASQAAMSNVPPGSSAQGEHPKFSARLINTPPETFCNTGRGDFRGESAAAPGTVRHVLVKFSPPCTTPQGVRWADLLVAEHLALQTLQDHGADVAHSELLEGGNQVFLESARFDRIGAHGRRGVVSLYALDLARYGQLDSWSACAQRLSRDALLSSEDAERITLLDTFGALIANTDRHFGNITLFDDYEGQFQLAPVYDMLPMLFAPRSDQIIERSFQPAGPSAMSLSVWSRARQLAEDFWERVSQDMRISAGFREICKRCLDAVRTLR